MISVLIADDSALVREVLRDMLETEPDIEVIGQAKDGAEAVEKTGQLSPDILIMDVRMPIKDGLTATQEIMAYYPTPILIFSSAVNKQDTKIAFQAISYGALDVMEKPSGIHTDRYEEVKKDLVSKIRLLSRIHVIAHVGGKMLERPVHAKQKPLEAPSKHKIVRRLVAIGASTGGPRALVEIFRELPANMTAPVVIVQHISPSFTQGMGQWLARESRLKVKMASDGETLKTGEAYLAPSGHHLTIDKNRLHLADEEPVNACKPSVDVLFNSVANFYGESSMAVLLTGMGRDGAEGMKKIHDRQGYTIVQDQASSVIFGMPKAAIDLGAVDEVLPLADISGAIIRSLKE
jgi:two-component system chemotaxis response regulator CheB